MYLTELRSLNLMGPTRFTGPNRILYMHNSFEYASKLDIEILHGDTEGIEDLIPLLLTANINVSKSQPYNLKISRNGRSKSSLLV